MTVGMSSPTAGSVPRAAWSVTDTTGGAAGAASLPSGGPSGWSCDSDIMGCPQGFRRPPPEGAGPPPGKLYDDCVGCRLRCHENSLSFALSVGIC